MKNLNAYDPALCQEYCRQLPFFKQLEKDFDHLRWEKHWTIHLMDHTFTPREFYGAQKLLPEKTMFSMVPFFYLKKLLDKNPEKIYDLGCGWNIFKKYIPNIIGVSPTHNTDHYADSHDIVDQDYINGHRDYFNSVFSINALHHRPLTEIKQVVEEFASMVSGVGTGFLTLNLQRLIERTSRSQLIEQFGTPAPTDLDYDCYVRKSLSEIDVNYLIFDIDFDIIDDIMDGNIRIVFDKCKDKNGQ